MAVCLCVCSWSAVHYTLSVCLVSRPATVSVTADERRTAVSAPPALVSLSTGASDRLITDGRAFTAPELLLATSKPHVYLAASCGKLTLLWDAGLSLVWSLTSSPRRRWNQNSLSSDVCRLTDTLAVYHTQQSRQTTSRGWETGNCLLGIMTPDITAVQRALCPGFHDDIYPGLVCYNLPLPYRKTAAFVIKQPIRIQMQTSFDKRNVTNVVNRGSALHCD